MFVSRYKVIHGKDLKYFDTMPDRRVRGDDCLVASNVHTITAHEGDVTAVAFSKTVLATCSSDKTVRLWNARDFVELPSSPLLGHKYLVHCCEFSPSGSILATCSADGTLRLWDFKTGDCVACLSHPSKSAIRVCRFSSDGTRIVTGGDDETVCLWDMADKRIIRSFKGHDESVTAAAFSPDDSYIVTCSSGGDLGGDMLVWDAKFGHGKFLTRVHDCHDLGVSCCSFSPTVGMSGSSSSKQFLLATGGNDNLVKFWTFKANVGSVSVTVKLETMLPGHRDSILWLCFSPNGKYIASSSLDKTVRLWNALTQQAIISIDEHLSYVAFCAFSSDSNYLATASNDRTVKIWKLSDTSHIMEKLSGYEEGGITPGYPTDEPSHAAILMEDWSVQDVCDWLCSLGLKEHEEKFRSNAIDGKELSALTAEDLESTLGVVALGHRNKILRSRAVVLGNASPIKTKVEPNDTPEEFLCPITHEIMKEPVIASDGYTYDKLAITNWIEAEKRSPMTNMDLTSTDLVPNRTLKMMIQKFLQKNVTQ